MNRIKHIAIFTPDPEKTANFYADVFGLEVAGPAGRGGIYLSDGYINLAILMARDLTADNPAGFQTPAGIDHFGFQVDDLEATQGKLAEYGAEELPSHAPPRARCLLLRVPVPGARWPSGRRHRERLGCHGPELGRAIQGAGAGPSPAWGGPREGSRGLGHGLRRHWVFG